MDLSSIVSSVSSAVKKPSPGSARSSELRPAQTGGLGAVLTSTVNLTSSPLLNRFFTQDQISKAAFNIAKSGTMASGAAARSFKKVSSSSTPKRLSTASGDNAPVDFTLDDDQKMIVETVQGLSESVLRPAASDANEELAVPSSVTDRINELGIPSFSVPEELGGIAGARNAMTNALVAEALSHGDMGLALPTLASSGVSNTLALLGDASQQQTYLPEFASEKPPAAAVALCEPRALFNPFELSTTATRSGEGFTLNGVKSLVPVGADCELFIVSAELEGSIALFIVESSTDGVRVEADPSMGLRAASLTRVHFKNVSLPAQALLGADVDADTRAGGHRDIVRLSRLGWASMACGTSQAVLDYVIPYVKEREAFGEPVAHRQSVAFMVANIGIELEGMRLVTWRGASRADQGLSFAREASLARKLCADKGMQIGLDGVQLLGGHGFTKEHPVERWYRDLRAIGIAEGLVVI